ncbi:hypothetical protein ABZV15_07875 [Streptomyces sp. NPDC005246]|uniref:hypothetical protein n=1 Tax=Streptomyces sp. NPDC005246 TaxID=3156716 RepID=UPI0033B0263A
MSPEERQEALERHGLTETQDGFVLSLRGFQRAARRALELRKQGDQEAVRMLALPPDDPLRWEYALCIQIEAFRDEWYESEF